MFARLFKSARSFIDPPPANTTPTERPPKSANETMVRTRNQRNQNTTEGEELNVENLIDISVPTPSSKRKSHKISSNEQPAISSPSPKKRKTLPVRAKDAESIVPDTRPVVEIPIVSASPAASSKKVGETVDIGSAKKHKKFGSEEPEEEIFSTAPDTQEDEELDGDDSSDDDAPEEVGAEDAARDVKAQVQSAAEAIKSSRKKRKDRSSKVEIMATGNHDLELPAEDDEDDDVVDLEVQPVVDEQSSPHSPSASLSEEDSQEEAEDEPSDEEEASPPVQIVRPRKTTFEQFPDKPPKDRKVGSTTYRVTKVESGNLAPKADRNARAVKESWLQGRSSKGIGANRKPMKQGFFRK